MADERERIEEQPDVQRELQRSGGAPRQAPEVAPEHKTGITLWLAVMLALAIVYYLLRLQAFGVLGPYLAPTRRVVVGAMAAALVLALSRAIEACVTRARDIVTASWTRLDPLLPESQFKIVFRAFSAFVLDRHY